MKTLGLCAAGAAENLNYEKGTLLVEAQKQYDRVLLIDPRLVTYGFLRGEDTPQIMYKGQDLSKVNSLIVRGAKGRRPAVAILVRALALCGCDVFDPIERFMVGHDTKLLTTLERFQNKVGTSTYFSFAHASAVDLLHRLDAEKRFPLLTKPVDGKQGRGIAVIATLQQGLEHIDQFFGVEKYAEEPFYLQNFESFQHEYRVLVVDGQALGVAEKVKSDGATAANAAQGGTFIAANVPDIVSATVKAVNHVGILGVDVAVDDKGEIHIIEANRAPQWQAFENATGINVAEAIVKRSLAR